MAFEVKLPHVADDKVASASPGKSERVLAARPSDTVDVGNPATRVKWKEFVAQKKKHGGDVTCSEIFAKAAWEMLKGGGSMAPTDALSTAMNLTLQALPREFDFIASFEKGSKATKIALGGHREHFARRLSVLAVAEEYCSALTACFKRFRSMMEEYQFPKYNLDVDSFVNDLWQAQAREAYGVKEQEQAESTKRELEFVALTAQLAETSQNLAIALQAPARRFPTKGRHPQHSCQRAPRLHTVGHRAKRA